MSGQIYFDRNNWMIPIWKPNAWNKFCLYIHDEKKCVDFTVNGQVIIQSYSYKEKPDVAGDIFLLNYNTKLQYLFNSVSFSGSTWCPMHGAITDLQVWDKIVKESEYFPFSTLNHPSGNIISWDTANITTKLSIVNTEVLFADNPKVEAFREVEVK